MKRIKTFIIYFPIILVALQVIVNLYALIDRSGYNAIGFYLSIFVGTNILFSLFLVAFTFAFKFCAISRGAAVTELLYGLAYLVIQEDNLYNILFQVITGIVALIATYRFYIKKFPLCRISLFHKFMGAVVLTGSCSSAIQHFEQDVKAIINQHGGHP